MERDSISRFDLEYYFGVVVKWYWVLLIPFTVSVCVGMYLVAFSQRYYESRTVILVQPQKLPTDVVRNIVAEDINTRVSTLSQRIQSRTNLEKIIKEFDLFADGNSGDMYMEDKVDVLRKRISVKMTNGRNRNADSFAVTYRGTDPFRVMKITQSLATYIIDENLKLRETQVLGTNSFLEDELESMRGKLVTTETSLKNYRERYMGGLPEQLNSNLRILESLNESLAHVRDQIRASKFRLDSFLQQQKRASVAGEDPEISSGDIHFELERLRAELGRRLKRYTKYHPDVLQLQAMIQQLEQQEAQGQGMERPDGRRGDTAYDHRLIDIQSEIELNEKEQQKLMAQIAVYKKRVEDTPKREQELLSLQRDYDNIREAYHSLLGRQLESQIAVNMERKQKGEQFRIIDPARVSQKPVQPNIKKMVPFVLAVGLGIGVGIVALLEFLMQTFRGPKAVESFTSLPIIATIPTRHRPGGMAKVVLRRLIPITGGLTTIILLGAFLGLAYIKG
ncbi:chain-length determining protein [Desulfoluna limicola]|uniref:Chain-length determining protein n=1 Tax=Desulfoluna limicola TaxID=2810562 RepID=A0ABM7PHR0_9BACT|nr:GNVR domain-containing protein [Desulfoluna limicola]BCS97107.1 chain-length determining protein [Desulfoluna limicola]